MCVYLCLCLCLCLDGWLLRGCVASHVEVEIEIESRLSRVRGAAFSQSVGIGMGVADLRQEMKAHGNASRAPPPEAALRRRRVAGGMGGIGAVGYGWLRLWLPRDGCLLWSGRFWSDGCRASERTALRRRDPVRVLLSGVAMTAGSWDVSSYLPLQMACPLVGHLACPGVVAHRAFRLMVAGTPCRGLVVGDWVW